MKHISFLLNLGFGKVLLFRALLPIHIILTPLLTGAQIVNQNPEELRQIDVEERSGELIPLDLEFTDEQGKSVALREYFSEDRPVILVLAYYECPMLCTMVLNGITQSVYNMDLELGKDYKLLTVSIDPSETPELAAAKKRAHLKMLEQEQNEEGWRFLVGDEHNIKALADAVGFRFYYVADRDEFAHPAVIMLLTDEGKISRYLYGIEYKPIDVKLGLLEAARGKVGSTIDRIILYCYHYDPDAKGYVVFAGNVMRLGGVATLIILFFFLGLLWLKDIRKKKTAFSKN